jgi:hypothetical protein
MALHMETGRFVGLFPPPASSAAGDIFPEQIRAHRFCRDRVAPQKDDSRPSAKLLTDVWSGCRNPSPLLFLA